LPLPDDGHAANKVLVRCYSLSDSPNKDYYRVSIKRVPAPPDRTDLPPGRGSNYFHEQVQVGSHLQVRAPAGHFHLLEEASLPVVLIAGGIGITPMLSILNSLLERGSERQIWLFYGVRDGSEVIMKEQLQALAHRHAHFHLHLCYSRPDEREVLGVDFHHRGRVDVPLILVSGDDKLKNQLSWMYWLEYVMVKTAKKADDALLLPLADVHEELYQAAGRALRQLSRSKAVKPITPIKAQLKAVHPASLSSLDGVPGINYQDNTVTFIAKDFKEAYKGIEVLIDVASQGYNRIFMKVLRSQKLLDKVWPIFIDEWYKCWMDVESGRWKPPAPGKKKTKKRKYYGF